MRLVICGFGWLCLLASLAIGAWEIFGQREGGETHLRPAGELWFQLDTGSLNLMQAIVERYIWPPLWDPGVVSLLQLPALLIFAVPGLLLVLLCYLPLFGKTKSKRKWRFRRN